MQTSKLKISPLVVVTKKYRLGWVILEIFFPVYNNLDSNREVIQDIVNITTIIKYPQDLAK